jgi:predicted ATPase
VYEFVHSRRTQGWLVLESASVSYGKATPYLPVIDLLKRYVHIEEADEARTVRARVTGQVLTLDDALQEHVPALLALLEALPDDSPFRRLDPPQRRQRTLEALKRVLVRESQVQPLLLVFEDLHWLDTETQALLDSLVDSLPTTQIVLLVNYRPEYYHAWGSKTYYTQLRLDPLLAESAEAFLQALLGDGVGAPHTASLQALKQLLLARTAGNPFRGERAHPGRDRGTRWRARPLSPGAGRVDPAGAGHSAGGAGGAYRPLAAGGKAAVADGGGDRHRGLLAAVTGYC